MTVTDGDNPITQDLTISVANLNDNAPTFTSSASYSVDENQTAIGTVTATDADGNLNELTFSVSGSELAITSAGVLTFATAPDYETKSSYTATVTATDGTNPTTQNVTVNINDLNDNNISITDPDCDTRLSQCALIFVYENNPDYTYQVTVEDLDPNRDLRYELYCPNPNQCGQSWWTISGTGLISIPQSIRDQGGFDFEYMAEIGATHGIGIRVYDDLAGPLSGESDTTYANFRFMNVEEAVVLDSGQTCSQPENASDTITIRCDFDNKTDPDCTQFVSCGATYTWSFPNEGLDGNHNYFNLNTSNGTITFKSAFDYENPQDVEDVNFTIDGDNIYEFDLSVSDGTFTSTQEVKVIITDVNDVAPVPYYIGVPMGLSLIHI